MRHSTGRSPIPYRTNIHMSRRSTEPGFRTHTCTRYRSPGSKTWPKNCCGGHCVTSGEHAFPPRLFFRERPVVCVLAKVDTMSDGKCVRKGTVEELAEKFGGAVTTRSPPLTPAMHAEALATTELEPEPGLEPGAAPPSPSEQRDAMRRCLGGTSPSSMPMKSGETWYVVSQQWWQCWCAYVG